MKLPIVISLRNDLPICAMPKGSFMRVAVSTLSKFVKMPWAVSGRSQTWAASSSTGPTYVLNMRLNMRGSDSLEPSSGHFSGSSSWSARYRDLDSRQSTIGSLNPVTCPDASHVRGFWMIDESSPTMLSNAPSGPVGGQRTISRHHASRRLFLSSTPSGP